MARASIEDMVAEVKAYALEHYNEGGWDVIVECWTDEMIASELVRTRTLHGAVRKIAQLTGVYAERQADARNSAF